MDRSSRNRLNRRHLGLFPGETLFDRIARAVCRAECLPRKELFEAWEVARQVRRRISGRRVVDLACGHGLLAHIMLILDGSTPAAVAVDRSLPKSAAVLSGILREEWPRLKALLEFRESDLNEFEAGSDDLLLSVHGCGSLTDRIIEIAIAARAAVALLPCCHDLDSSPTGSLEGWLEPTLAVDVTRAQRLQAAGYRVVTRKIPGEITPKNRLLIAWPENGRFLHRPGP